MKGGMEVTVVVPCYNEEKTLAKVINGINKKYEILAVLSKRNTDNSEKILKDLGVDYIIDNGIGKGEALRLAIKHIKSRIVVFIDADGSHNPKDIPKLVEPIKKGDAEMVVASRKMGGSAELKGFRKIFTEIVNLIINLRFGANITDSQNGFRAIITDVARNLNLRSNTTTIEQEMCMKCLKNGYTIKEVPSFETEGGKSSFSLLERWPRYLLSLIRNIF